MEFWRYRSRPVVNPIDPAVAPPVTTDVGPPDRTAAFEQGVRLGRKQERSRHNRHPLMKFAVVVVAIAGAAGLALAAHEGSFSRGGAVVDHNLAVAADNAQVSAANAAAQAGQAVKEAGDKVAKKVTDATAAKH
jgi:hypothetical protein